MSRSPLSLQSPYRRALASSPYFTHVCLQPGSKVISCRLNFPYIPVNLSDHVDSVLRAGPRVSLWKDGRYTGNPGAAASAGQCRHTASKSVAVCVTLAASVPWPSPRRLVIYKPCTGTPRLSPPSAPSYRPHLIHRFTHHTPHTCVLYSNHSTADSTVCCCVATETTGETLEETP